MLELFIVLVLKYSNFQCSDQADVGKRFLALTYADRVPAHLDFSGLLDFFPPYLCSGICHLLPAPNEKRPSRTPAGCQQWRRQPECHRPMLPPHEWLCILPSHWDRPCPFPAHLACCLCPGWKWCGWQEEEKSSQHHPMDQLQAGAGFWHVMFMNSDKTRS